MTFAQENKVYLTYQSETLLIGKPHGFLYFVLPHFNLNSGTGPHTHTENPHVWQNQKLFLIKAIPSNKILTFY